MSGLLRPLVLAAAVALLAACGKKTESSPSTEKSDRGATVATDKEHRGITELDDQALVVRVRKSAECGTVEPVPCDDVEIQAVRCELALRASKKSAVKEALLSDARGGDRARRGAALRVLADLKDEAAVRVVHDALVDPDATVSCRAASYGIWFKTEDAPRLKELSTKCDGAGVITATAALVEKGKPGEIVKAGATCDEIRNAADAP
jgi:hypothetical protein